MLEVAKVIYHTRTVSSTLTQAYIFVRDLVFAVSVRTMLVLPQVAQVSFYSLIRKNKQCCTYSRDLTKDTLMRDKNWKSTAPSWNRTHNFWRFALLMCILPLCYNHCPILIASSAFLKLKMGKKFKFHNLKWIFILPKFSKVYSRLKNYLILNVQG